MEETPSFQDLNRSGITAFERGQYRFSIEQLEAALQLVSSGSREAGETGFWLISAYQGLGDDKKAAELCRALTQHPIYQIREQASRLLYIIEAPRLKRPEEWMTKIPDLETLPDSEPKFKKGSNQPQNAEIPAPMQLDRQQDPRFIQVAIGVVFLLLIGLLIANTP